MHLVEIHYNPKSTSQLPLSSLDEEQHSMLLQLPAILKLTKIKTTNMVSNFIRIKILNNRRGNIYKLSPASYTIMPRLRSRFLCDIYLK